MSGRRAQSAAILAGLSGVLGLAGISAATAASPGASASSLGGKAGALGARAHHALLDLYALDTSLQQARAQLSSLESDAAGLRSERALLQQQASATQQTLASSQHRLGANLRTLYEQGDTDALAVMLGAQSLDDAVTRLDDLTRVADQSSAVLRVTRAARLRLAHVRGALAQQTTRLTAAITAARRTEAALAAARTQRLAFIADLRSAQRLKERQIAALQQTAQHVEAKSQKLQVAADTAAATALPATTTPATPPQPALGAHTITVSSTGYALSGRTATGIPVSWGVVAVDPSLIPLGTRLTIPGYGEGVAADTGGAVRGATIDLWFPTLAQALAWGRRTVTITIH